VKGLRVVQTSWHPLKRGGSSKEEVRQKERKGEPQKKKSERRGKANDHEANWGGEDEKKVVGKRFAGPAWKKHSDGEAVQVGGGVHGRVDKGGRGTRAGAENHMDGWGGKGAQKNATLCFGYGGSRQRHNPSTPGVVTRGHCTKKYRKKGNGHVRIANLLQYLKRGGKKVGERLGVEMVVEKDSAGNQKDKGGRIKITEKVKGKQGGV